MQRPARLVAQEIAEMGLVILFAEDLGTRIVTPIDDVTMDFSDEILRQQQ